MFLVEQFDGGEQQLVDPRYACSTHCLVSFSWQRGRFSRQRCKLDPGRYR